MTPLRNEVAAVRRVLIVNSSQDVVDMLRLKFELAGWTTAMAHVHDAKAGKVDLVEIAEAHQASVIVYDVAPPYEENWHLLERMRDAPAMANRAFIITTTNARQLEKICGVCDAVEIVGKPYDLSEVLNRATSLLPA